MHQVRKNEGAYMSEERVTEYERVIHNLSEDKDELEYQEIKLKAEVKEVKNQRDEALARRNIIENQLRIIRTQNDS